MTRRGRSSTLEDAMSGTPVEPTIMRAELSTDPPESWVAITDPAVVERWFTKATPVGPVGAEYVLDFGEGDPMRGVVLEVVAGTRLAYSWGWGETPADRRTRVTWDLEPLPLGGTLVTLTHGGWTEAGLAATDRDEHEEHWVQYLAALVELTDELAGIEVPD
jgi:uncharacterized protein YndB with AHSA1/START domain